MQTLGKLIFAHPLPVLGLAVCMIAPAVGGGQQDSRKAWQYKVAAGNRTIFDTGGGKWIVYTPKGSTFIYLETSREADYIEMRSTQNENVFRLFQNHGEVRKTADGPWGRFATGRWLEKPDAYKFDKFGPLDYKLRLVYFVPKDREPKPNYDRKIRVVMRFVSAFFQQDLTSKGYKTDGFQFELDNEGQPRVHLLNGEENADYYNDSGAFQSPRHHQRIAGEIARKMGDGSRHVVVVFAETYGEGPAERVWPGHIAQAFALSPDGGNATFSAWMLRDEFCALTVAEQRRLFFDATAVRGRRAIGHRGPNSPRFEFVEDAIGGVIHEVGHALGLPHDHRKAELYIMGTGFRNLRWNVAPSRSGGQKAQFSDASALLLMSSRYLAKDKDIDRLDYQPPQVDFQLNRARGAVFASVTATDDKGLRAAVFVDENHKQRSMVLARKLSGKRQEVKERLPASVLNSGAAKIKVMVVDTGGNYTQLTRSTR